MASSITYNTLTTINFFFPQFFYNFFLLLNFIFLFCREDAKVSHYIINKIQQNGQTVYRIGDQCFPDLPELLSFYKLHYLDTTPLRRPLLRKNEIVVGKFDFEGSVSILKISNKAFLSQLCINRACYS